MFLEHKLIYSLVRDKPNSNADVLTHACQILGQHGGKCLSNTHFDCKH